MGSSLAVILSNMWLKQFKPCIGGMVPESLESLETGEFTDTAATPDVQESSESADTGAFTVTAAAVCLLQKAFANRGFSVRCCQCLCWAHRACATLTVAEVKSLSKRKWFLWLSAYL